MGLPARTENDTFGRAKITDLSRLVGTMRIFAIPKNESIGIILPEAE